MAGIAIKKNGRTIPLNRLADEMMADVRAAAAEEIRRRVEARLRSITCPAHGRAARSVNVVLSGARDRGTVSVDTCCEQPKGATLPQDSPGRGHYRSWGESWGARAFRLAALGGSLATTMPKVRDHAQTHACQRRCS